MRELEIEIEWRPLGITVTAQLFDEPNRNLSNLLWELLPYNSLQNHALVSGRHLYHLVPSLDLICMPAEKKEDRTQSPDGTLFLSQLQHLAIKYGALSEYIPAAPVGRVIAENLPLLRAAGEACWDATFTTKQVIEVRIARKGASAPHAFSLPPLSCATPEPILSLIARIQQETQRVWVDPPKEIVDLHRGVIPSGAGSFDQYFSTLVFLNGETRPLGYCALNGLIRLSRSEQITLAALREMTPNFIRTPAEFLGYCGLGKLWSFTQELLELLPHLQTKQQFTAAAGALVLYANVLNTWNLQFFPWKHGADYPARTRG